MSEVQFLNALRKQKVEICIADHVITLAELSIITTVDNHKTRRKSQDNCFELIGEVIIYLKKGNIVIHLDNGTESLFASQFRRLVRDLKMYMPFGNVSKMIELIEKSLLVRFVDVEFIEQTKSKIQEIEKV